MKTILPYLTCLFLVFGLSSQLWAQTEIKPDPKKALSKAQQTAQTDSILVNVYLTEADYNEKHHIKNKTITRDVYGDEFYAEEKMDHYQDDAFLNDVATEVIIEVIVNAFIIVATFWQ